MLLKVFFSQRKAQPKSNSGIIFSLKINNDYYFMTHPRASPCFLHTPFACTAVAQPAMEHTLNAPCRLQSPRACKERMIKAEEERRRGGEERGGELLEIRGSLM